MRVSTESGQTRYYDAETELHYNRFRYYDPSIGRYISADPIGQIGGINTFLYARNEPLNSIDPLGLGPGDWTPGSAARDAYSRARDAIESVPDPRKAARDAAAKALGEIGGETRFLFKTQTTPWVSLRTPVTRLANYAQSQKAWPRICSTAARDTSLTHRRIVDCFGRSRAIRPTRGVSTSGATNGPPRFWTMDDRFGRRNETERFKTVGSTIHPGTGIRGAGSQLPRDLENELLK
jgi:RHS repeat-associated protein